jgi:hypothetical protein
LDGYRLISVTQFTETVFPTFDADKAIRNMSSTTKKKYWNYQLNQPMTDEAIKQKWEDGRKYAATRGSEMHKCIDDYLKGTIDLNRFIQLIPVHGRSFRDYMAEQSRPLFRTEWAIYNEDVRLAGTVDALFLNPDGSVTLVDWKCSDHDLNELNIYNSFSTHMELSHVPDTRWGHYAVQLNVYKYIIESKYGLIVRNMQLVQFKSSGFKVIEMPDLSVDIGYVMSERAREKEREQMV